MNFMYETRVKSREWSCSLPDFLHQMVKEQFASTEILSDHTEKKSEMFWSQELSFPLNEACSNKR